MERKNGKKVAVHGGESRSSRKDTRCATRDALMGKDYFFGQVDPYKKMKMLC